MTAKLGVLSRRASVEGSDRYELPRTVRRALQQREGEQRKSSPTDHIDLGLSGSRDRWVAFSKSVRAEV